MFRILSRPLRSAFIFGLLAWGCNADVTDATTDTRAVATTSSGISIFDGSGPLAKKFNAVELQVLRLVSQGYSNTGIARIMNEQLAQDRVRNPGSFEFRFTPERDGGDSGADRARISTVSQHIARVAELLEVNPEHRVELAQRAWALGLIPAPQEAVRLDVEQSPNESLRSVILAMDDGTIGEPDVGELWVKLGGRADDFGLTPAELQVLQYSDRNDAQTALAMGSDFDPPTISKMRELVRMKLDQRTFGDAVRMARQNQLI